MMMGITQTQWAPARARMRAAGMLCAGLALSACDSSGAAFVDSFASEKRALLAEVADTCVSPALQQADERAQLLVTGLEAYADRAVQGQPGQGQPAQDQPGQGQPGQGQPGQGQLEQVQSAWVAMMEVWQRLEVFRFGPAASPTRSPGGQDLGAAIYSWPSRNACAIDQRTVAGGYEPPSALAAQLVTVRGLDAVEYLLFSGSDANACSAVHPINAPATASPTNGSGGAWASLSAEEVRARRARYAHSAASLAAENVRKLEEAWARDFRDAFAEAGNRTAVYPTAQSGLEALVLGLLFVDRQLKDNKFADPAGISTACDRTNCPDLLESPYAERSLEHARANVEGLRCALVGNGTGGLTKLLKSMGATKLAGEVEADLAAVESAMQALDPPLTRALSQSEPQVRAIFDALLVLSRRLKTEVLGVLDVQPRLDGDND